jgi:hypothetical protein
MKKESKVINEQEFEGYDSFFFLLAWTLYKIFFILVKYERGGKWGEET